MKTKTDHDFQELGKPGARHIALAQISQMEFQACSQQSALVCTKVEAQEHTQKDERTSFRK